MCVIVIETESSLTAKTTHQKDEHDRSDNRIHGEAHRLDVSQIQHKGQLGKDADQQVCGQVGNLVRCNCCDENSAN